MLDKHISSWKSHYWFGNFSHLFMSIAATSVLLCIMIRNS
uniref:Uncharacterized protein n=1 Tax=Rhizophora mucronata TaxID=61149 RepID=A0A2P2J379_RHIMU